MHRSTRLLGLLLILIAAPAAGAAGISPPDTLAGARRLSERELANKKEGSSFAFLPGPSYSPDLGLIIGTIAGYYYNGERTDPYFAYTPYRHGVSILASISGRGMFSLIGDYDAPYFRDSDVRIRARLRFVRNPTETYFGEDSASLRPLTTPDGRVMDSFSDYEEYLRRIEDGHTSAYYNFYLNRVVSAGFEVGRAVGPAIVASAGLSVARRWIGDYTGEMVLGKAAPDAKRSDALMRETLLRRHQREGRISGFKGGWENSLRIGIAYDTRDLEPNPRRGMFHDVTVLVSDRVLGSSYSYAITTVSARFYHSPLRAADLILAARLLYAVKSSGTPFFTMTYLPTTDRHIYGLGGDTTIRGFRQARFSGPVAALANAEIRYVFAGSHIAGQFLEWMAVPFVDIGRVYDSVSQTNLRDFKYAYGAGLRLGYNQAFVVSFDYGFSPEERLFYLGVGHIF